jgi:hypothetical protein
MLDPRIQQADSGFVSAPRNPSKIRKRPIVTINLLIYILGALLLLTAGYVIIDSSRMRRDSKANLVRPSGSLLPVPGGKFSLSNLYSGNCDDRLLDMYKDLAERVLPHLLYYSQDRQAEQGKAVASCQLDPEVFNGFLWMLKEINRALPQLESQNPDEVLAGYQTISALGIPFLLPYLEEVRLKWSKDARVLKQMGAAKDLMTV